MDQVPLDTGKLHAIATRLADIAAAVATESEVAVTTIRALTDQAHDVAALAAAFDAAAAELDQTVRAQADALTAARASLAADEPVLQAMAQSIEAVGAISGTIGRIATDSRMLSLNARIEAARAGPAGASFAVVAQQMSALTEQTRVASAEIGSRAGGVVRDMESARRIVAASAELAATQQGLIAAAAETSSRQREAAAAMSRMTGDAASRIAEAAEAIGRLGSTGTAVKMLARQVTRLAAA